MDFQNWIRSYVIQVIPLISLVIYALGFSYYIAYYSVFGINIISYITLSEVLVAALMSIVICLVLGLVGITMGRVYLQAMMPNIKHCMSVILSERIKSLIEKFIVKIGFDRLRRRLFYTRYVALIMFMLLVIFISEVEMDTFTKRIVLIACVISICIYVYSCLRYYSQLRMYHVRMVYTTFMWSVIGVGSIVALAFLGVKEGKAMMQSEPDYFEVTMTGGNHYTSAIYTYIGDSSTAIFLYERNSCRSLILNRANTVSVTLWRSSNIDRILFRPSGSL